MSEIPSIYNDKKAACQSLFPLAKKETIGIRLTDAPLSIMEEICNSNDPNALMDTFAKCFNSAMDNPALFKETLKEVVGNNDNVNLTELEEKTQLSPEDKSKLNIRIMARCIARLGEIKTMPATDKLLRILEKIDELPQNEERRFVDLYFREEAYTALAKNNPVILKEKLNQNQGKDPSRAALALLRQGVELPQEQIRSIAQNGDVELLYYISDPNYKINLIKKELQSLQKMSYTEKCWREREIINILASFPEGEKALEELKGQKAIDYIKIDGFYFGTLKGSSVSIEEIKDQTEGLAQSANFLKKANLSFPGKEKVRYIDISPDSFKGKRMNDAGWGNAHLYMTIGILKNSSTRALSFILLHERCELEITKGKITSEFSKTYIEALKNHVNNGQNSLLEEFRLGKRIGGNYTNSNLGHPWDSEREWLAEVGSATIIGEPLSPKTAPALNAVRKMLKESVSP